MTNHDDADDVIDVNDAVITAARVLDGLAGLLGESSTSKPDPAQRERKARLFRRTALALLDGHGLPHDHLDFSSEWTGNLSHLLGVR